MEILNVPPDNLYYNNENIRLICYNDKIKPIVSNAFENNISVENFIEKLRNLNEDDFKNCLLSICGAIAVQKQNFTKYGKLLYDVDKKNFYVQRKILGCLADNFSSSSDSFCQNNFKDIVDPLTNSIIINFLKVNKPESNPNNFTIFVKTLTGKTISIPTNKNSTILEIKYSILEKEGIPLDQQRVIFKGRQLEDELSVNYYNINYKDTLHLVLGLRGGMHHISSGRIDYCSRKIPEQIFGLTENKEILESITINFVNKIEGNPFLDSITIHYHPKCPEEIIMKMIEMETDINYFDNNLENVQNIYKNMLESLSRNALLRFLNRK